ECPPACPPVVVDCARANTCLLAFLAFVTKGANKCLSRTCTSAETQQIRPLLFARVFILLEGNGE
ncbi:Hypothetical predicted protein, partial [Cloeon dipterum]